MKRIALVVLVVLALAGAGAVFAATWLTGGGKGVQASTTPQAYAFTTTVNTVSIDNQGTNPVFVLVNTTTNVLISRLALGTALPIPQGTYTFDAQGKASIRNLCYATSNGVSQIYIAGY